MKLQTDSDGGREIIDDKNRAQSRERQKVLAIAAQNGDDLALGEMVGANYGLASYWANKFSGRGLEIADLQQEAVLGLIHAIKKFNPQLGYTFSTYASIWIRKYLQSAIHAQGRVIKVPIQIAIENTSLDRAADEFSV